MLRQTCPIVLAAYLLGAFWFVYGPATRANAQEQTRVEWTFTDGQRPAWSPGSIADLKVADGRLQGTPTGNDPLLIGPVFDAIATTATQWVEIRMKSAPGRAELFWTETLEGRFGGFSGSKLTVFDCVGDDEIHTYRIRPFWHTVGKVVRLRLDPPSAGPFEIASIRIVEPEEQEKPTADTRWDFRESLAPWHWTDDPTGIAAPALLESPLLDVSADDHPLVHVRMAVDQGLKATLRYVTSKSSGWQETEFPLTADGRTHSYNIDLGTTRSYGGQVVLLGLQPSDVTDAKVSLETVELTDKPAGPVDVRLRYFGRTEGVNRVGKPVQITALLENQGGTLAAGFTATLHVAQGIEVIGPTTQTIESLGFYKPVQLRWTVRGMHTGEFPLRLTVDDSAASPSVLLSANAQIELTPSPTISATDYIPEPQPVASKYEVGTYYFPGWHTRSRWNPILGYPMRKPILGWYDESNPEIADWQIKWAVEHGVNFFLVDWYWNQGNRHLEHWLHESFAKARFRKYMKWCVMWANHNAASSHSKEDWRKVTQYWIDNYFADPQYYRINDRPAVFIWSPSNIRRDVKSSQNAAELYAMSQEMAREAGYKGIYFAAMFDHGSAPACQRLADEGYHGMTSYHGFEQLAGRLGKRFPFSAVVDYGPELWHDQTTMADGRLDYFPVVDTGWASEPWHGAAARTITDRTPELLGKLCREARKFADAQGTRTIVLGPWNEWGEGSYIEPYAEYGFSDLDEIRRAFCEPGSYPPNIVPADIGRGPYDLPEDVPATAWTFDQPGDRLGWSGNSVESLTVVDGALCGRSTGRDPVLNCPAIQIDTTEYRRLVVRMKANRDTLAQVFWGTSRSGHSERASCRVKVPGDGAFHEYIFDLGANRNWRGVATSLRFDAVSGSDVEFAIDSVRFE